VVEDLPEGAGREVVFGTCAACHGLRIVTQQGLPRERWDRTIDLMVERHGMPVPDAADRDRILDYLAEHFPPRRKAYENPFLKR
jgi:mono/diheme cytochrome c family protein